MPRKPTKSEIAEFVSAAGEGDIGAVRQFLGKGGSIDAVAANGLTALYAAAQSCDTDMLAFLLDAGANPNLRVSGSDNETKHQYALNVAAWYRSTKAIELLLVHGASARVLSRKSENAAHILLSQLNTNEDGAAPFQDFLEQILPRLFEAGLQPNQADENGTTALHLATRKCARSSVFRRLLDGGALPNLPDGFGDYPIHLASTSRHLEALHVLVSAGANVNAQDRSGATVLMKCAHQCVPELLALGAAADQPDSTGVTPLAYRVRNFCASGAICPGIVPLLDAGASVDTADFDGTTPRGLAARVPGLQPLFDARAARAAMLAAARRPAIPHRP
jgi:ankyrin repeat protein